MLMVLLDSGHSQVMFHVRVNVYLYVILRFQKEELESRVDKEMLFELREFRYWRNLGNPVIQS
jgi:hypothetical protein